MHQAKSRSRRILRIAARTVGVALVTAGTAALFGGCSRSMFMQSPWEAVPQATPEEISRLHQPEALRADLDRKSTRLNSSHQCGKPRSGMPSSA
jgi:hypothetical protein